MSDFVPSYRLTVPRLIARLAFANKARLQHHVQECQKGNHDIYDAHILAGIRTYQEMAKLVAAAGIEDWEMGITVASKGAEEQ